MRNAILIFFVGVIAVSLITIGAAYALPQEAMPPNTSQSASVGSAAQADYPYLLRSYEGKLAVFTQNTVQPDMVFDVYVRTLPEADREQLARGVRVETYEKLTALIEDYIS